jgi:hypothetical protein
MKWISIKTASRNEFYELWDNTKKILSLVFNSDLNTARIEHKENKRMFMMERVGFLKSKTILKNEYGVKVGQFGSEKWNSPEGFIDLDNERYYYSISNELLPELVIYKSQKTNPLLTCGLGDPQTKPKIGFSARENKYACILMAVCLYLFKPVNSKEHVEFAL